MQQAFTIREAQEQDIPAIVGLLKQSLGEVSSIKTEAYWRWKHVDNPFGPSPVFLALDGQQLVGVRAMMQWQWQAGTTVYKSLRAVDTATHPQYQGKGIFRCLTEAMIERAEADNYPFIFNTPNNKSLPGYLKMGWKFFSNAPVYVKPVVGFNFNAAKNWAFYQQTLTSLDADDLLFGGLYSHLLHTPKTGAYLNWRYRQCPFKDYGLVSGFIYGLPFGILMKRKKRGRFYELRICDYWLSDEACFSLLVDAATKAARATGCLFLSICLSGPQKQNSFQKMGFVSIKKKSPVITMRAIQELSVLTILQKPDQWHFHSGDLELF